jgi:hypothetical protein
MNTIIDREQGNMSDRTANLGPQQIEINPNPETLMIIVHYSDDFFYF